MSFTREEKRACLVRELRLRKKAYPRWVKAGRLRQEDAEREVAVLEAIIADYPEAEITGQGAFHL